MDEVILVDANDREIGRTSRKEAHEKGLLHRIAVIYLVKVQGQILVQQRLDYGRFDHSSAGHVDPDESYADAAKRELKEELGVDGILTAIGRGMSDEYKAYANEHVKHQFVLYECQEVPRTINKNEIQSVHWANPLEIWHDMNGDPDCRKYTGGFKASLRIYLEYKKLL